MKRAAQVQRILEERLIAIVRVADGTMLPRALEAMAEGGLRAIEITMTVPDALEHIRRMRSWADEKSILFGVGSVLDAETARLALLAGAEFIVSPVMRPEVIQTCTRYGAVVIPGCATPTEMLTAWELGADFVKVFPAASLGGPGFVRAVLNPLPQLRLVCTGSVTPEDATRYLEAGCVAVGSGYMVNDRLLEACDFAGITRRCIELRDAVASAGR